MTWRRPSRIKRMRTHPTWLLSIAKALSAGRRRMDAELNDGMLANIPDRADNAETVLQNSRANGCANA